MRTASLSKRRGFDRPSVKAAAMGLMTLTLATACQKKEAKPQVVPEVTVTQPTVKEVVEWDEFTGRLEPVKSVDVRSRVSGYLDSIHFKDGEEVKAGDLLFIVDPRPYQATVDRLKAELASAQAAKNLAQQNFDRAQTLLKGNTIAAETYDERRNELEIAIANIQQAEAALKEAELQLGFTQIKAPIPGRVGRRFVDEGNFISGGSADSTLLTTIVPFDPLYATFDVDERVVLKYTRLGLSGERISSRNTANPVRLALSDETEFEHEGRMDFVDNRIDPATGTLRGRALVQNDKGLLTPGLFVRVQLKGRGPYEALLVPDAAIGTDQSRRFVMVVDDEGLARRRYVQPGRLHDGLRAIEEGLNPDDRVIVGGLMRARVGEPVNASQAQPPPSPSPAPAADPAN